MRPSSSPSEGLLGPLSGTPDVDRELDDDALLRALLDTEGALALAAASTGVVPVDAAEAIAAACSPENFDPTDLGRRAVASGNPAVPLVRDLGATVPEHARPWVHHGATSQDVMDTALMLVAHRALGPIGAHLGGATDAAAGLAERHRATPMAGRTLGQQALPITFGLKAAGWLVALDEARADLAAVRDRRLAVQLGGAAGTLAPLGTAGVDVLRELAAVLGLAEPTVPWHTNRLRLHELAGALGGAAAVLGKVGLDVTLMAQTEVGEAVEAPDDHDSGGSSTLPHKQNPVRSVLVTAAARQVPALVASLLAAGVHEHERAAGAWQAEWRPLRELLRLVGGAAARTADLLTGLVVDEARMRANLSATGGLVMSESVEMRLAPTLGRAEAHELVARLSRVSAGSGIPLRDVLLADQTVAGLLTADTVDEALQPEGYLGSAAAFVDRALAAHARQDREAERP